MRKVILAVTLYSAFVSAQAQTTYTIDFSLTSNTTNFTDNEYLFLTVDQGLHLLAIKLYLDMVGISANL